MNMEFYYKKERKFVETPRIKRGLCVAFGTQLIENCFENIFWKIFTSLQRRFLSFEFSFFCKIFLEEKNTGAKFSLKWTLRKKCLPHSNRLSPKHSFCLLDKDLLSHQTIN